MRVLALDTATEHCSVALLDEDRLIERAVATPRGHAELILPMIEEVLQQGGLRLSDLDGIAYGRGPGAFTGVRIAVAVAQGLAFGAHLPTVGISDLAAVAQQVARPGERILVCMDARMGEVYWGRYHCPAASGLVVADGSEHVGPPQAVIAADATVFAGTGLRAYLQLEAPRDAVVIHDPVLPHARDVAKLAKAELLAGQGKPAALAQPVYLRDQVATVKGS